MIDRDSKQDSDSKGTEEGGSTLPSSIKVHQKVGGELDRFGDLSPPVDLHSTFFLE